MNEEQIDELKARCSEYERAALSGDTKWAWSFARDVSRELPDFIDIIVTQREVLRLMEINSNERIKEILKERINEIVKIEKALEQADQMAFGIHQGATREALEALRIAYENCRKETK